MSDIVERAKNWAADAKTAHVYGVGVRADLSTIGMVNELVAEVERLRSNLLQQDELVWRLEQGARRYRTEGRAEKGEGIHWALATIVEMSDAATE